MNTYGGLLSAVHGADYGGVIESVRQLRAECGERQVEGAAVAIANGHGGEMVFPYMSPIHERSCSERTVPRKRNDVKYSSEQCAAREPAVRKPRA